MSSGQGCAVIEVLLRNFAELAQGRKYLGNEKRKRVCGPWEQAGKTPSMLCLHVHPEARSPIMCSVAKEWAENPSGVSKPVSFLGTAFI